MKELIISQNGEQKIVDLSPDISDDYTDIFKPSYDDIVEQKIRQKYTVSAEFAVLRQQTDKTTEYAEYYAYCEQCKAEAKAELGLI